MGYTVFEFNFPTNYQESDLRNRIQKELRGVSEFTYQIEKQSLDARNKSHIHWKVRLGVVSPALPTPLPTYLPQLTIPYVKNRGTAVVVGCGPAGFFAAFVLQKAGFHVTLIERGADVNKRAVRIGQFEKTAQFDPLGNYAFGEGGAGTFSDGKLTARTKGVSLEKEFIISSYIAAGAPREIAYLAHPHLGSDNLKAIVRTLRKQFIDIGGTMQFETTLADLTIVNGTVTEVVTTNGTFTADHILIAPGHSAYDTYRMLMRRGVLFREKNFALGTRMEHSQELINRAQWGVAHVPGVKAAEYRLTSNGDGNFPVYSFCMCPGGIIVPAAATATTNIVNGMSCYARNGSYANAACVAGINLSSMVKHACTPSEALDWVESLETAFYSAAPGFQAPVCTIGEFLSGKTGTHKISSSYTLGLKHAPLWELLPTPVSSALRAGLKDFCKKMRGFETGTLLGLESKTSSPIQVVREPLGRCTGVNNLYVLGEGSGFSGGIISSAVDGVRCALGLLP